MLLYTTKSIHKYYVTNSKEVGGGKNIYVREMDATVLAICNRNF